MSDLTNKQHDVLLVAPLPIWDMQIPLCVPGVLKGIVESRGYSLKVYDAASDWFTKFCNSDVEMLTLSHAYFLADDEMTPLVKQFYQHVIDTIQTYNFKTLAISVFSVYTHKATFELLSMIREQLPDIKILVGGRGLTTRVFIGIASRFTAMECFIDFNKVLLKRKLVDHVILGDGEDAIIDFLKSNNQDTFTGIANKQLNYPFSNFDDLDLRNYIGISGTGRVQLPVFSSKGCVRACDFCDVGVQMGTFKSKNGHRLAEEIIYITDKYQIFSVAFMDSIVNGNLKELRNTCTDLAEYNKTQPDDKKIRWSGNWIARLPGATKPEFFELLKQSGCESVTIGAEHASNRVLKAMDKKTTVEGLYYELDELAKKGIQCILNNIVGHWSEEADDFTQLITMTIRNGPYYSSRVINSLAMGDFHLLKNTPAEQNYEHNGLLTLKDANFTKLWWTPKNPSNTVKARLARRLIFLFVGSKFNIPLHALATDLIVQTNLIRNETPIIDDFFSKTIDFTKYTGDDISISWLKNVEEYVDNILHKQFKTSDVKFKVNAHYYNGAPGLTIYHNGKIIIHQLLDEGITEFNFEILNDFSNLNNLKFEMFNKGEFDTEVDNSGNILRDKKIEFLSVIIDKTDLLLDPYLYYHKTSHVVNGVKSEISCAGLYTNNSSVQVDYTAPFWAWVLNNRKFLGFQGSGFSRHKKNKKLIKELQDVVLALKY